MSPHDTATGNALHATDTSLAGERCPVCGQAGPTPILTLRDVPVACYVLAPSRDAALRRPPATWSSPSATRVDDLERSRFS